MQTQKEDGNVMEGCEERKMENQMEGQKWGQKG